MSSENKECIMRTLLKKTYTSVSSDTPGTNLPVLKSTRTTDSASASDVSSCSDTVQGQLIHYITELEESDLNFRKLVSTQREVALQRSVMQAQCGLQQVLQRAYQMIICLPPQGKS